MKPSHAEEIRIVEEPALSRVREWLSACIQCGTCTASCPNEFAMDLTPRMLWRLVLLGQKEEIFRSHTFSLCSACYTCTLRCPRGLSLTEAMSTLKQIAVAEGIERYRRSTFFYQSFLESVRRHGRVREMEMMTLYFNRVKNPWLPLRFAGLGLKLMRRGKVPLQLPTKGRGRLTALFSKARQLEETS